MSSTVAVALLWVLTLAFAARVVGQIVAGLAAPPWLPPFERWYSGRMAYRYLLPAQLVILGVMAALNLALARGFHPRELWGGWGARIAIIFAALYAAAILVRWLHRSLQPPSQRGVFLPIPFHLVLATYLLVGGLV